MNKFRYVDKKILCNYDLSEELFNILGIDVKDLIPLRKVFIVITSQGKKILKYTEQENEKIEFINKCLNYIRTKDNNVLTYCRNTKGELITTWKNKKYVLLDLIEGREVSFTNPVEVELCSTALAEMHNSSKDIDKIFSNDIIDKYKGKSFIETMEEEKKLIIECKNIVSKFKYKNEFDLLFLSQYEDVYSDLCSTIELLGNCSYKINDNDLVLCHNDLAHHNFMIADNNINIIDFDYCNINTRIQDIYNFTNKVLKTVSYDKDYAKIILNGYTKAYELSNEEIEVLQCLIKYPKDFITLSRNYYLKQKSWDEEVFIARMKEKIELDQYRREII